MKKETKDKIKNFTIDVIDFFLGIPESFAIGLDRKDFYSYMNGFTEKQLTCSNIARLISNLKQKKYIEVTKSPHGESIKFTNKAKLAAVDLIAGKKESDGRHYFISFDVPEDHRSNRDRFRRLVKKIGFVQIQQSLWVCDKSVGELVELAAIEYGVKEYVVYIVSEHTDINDIIKRKLSHQ